MEEERRAAWGSMRMNCNRKAESVRDAGPVPCRLGALLWALLGGYVDLALRTT